MDLEYKSSFVFYESYGKQFERLCKRGKADKALEYITAVIRYGLYSEVPPEEAEVWDFGFDGVIATINSAKANRAKKINIPAEELKTYLDEGNTQEEIAGIYGCSVDTIQRRIKEYGIQKNRKTAPNTANRTAPQTIPQRTAGNYNGNENRNEKADVNATTTTGGLAF